MSDRVVPNSSFRTRRSRRFVYNLYDRLCLMPTSSLQPFYDLTDNVNSLDLENGVRWGKKTTK